MQEIIVAEDVPLSADAVWAVIGDFVRIDKWAKLVVEAESEVTHEGRFRLLTLQDGQSFRERLVDEGSHFYSYTLPRPGTTAYLSTVSVRPLAPSSSRIELIVRFEPAEGASVEDLTAQMTGFCRGNVKAMKRALGL